MLKKGDKCLAQTLSGSVIDCTFIKKIGSAKFPYVIVKGGEEVNFHEGKYYKPSYAVEVFDKKYKG